MEICALRSQMPNFRLYSFHFNAMRFGQTTATTSSTAIMLESIEGQRRTHNITFVVCERKIVAIVLQHFQVTHHNNK